MSLTLLIPTAINRNNQNLRKEKRLSLSSCRCPALHLPQPVPAQVDSQLYRYLLDNGVRCVFHKSASEGPRMVDWIGIGDSLGSMSSRLKTVQRLGTPAGLSMHG